jgi:Ca-activated chloride channel homolog
MLASACTPGSAGGGPGTQNSGTRSAPPNSASQSGRLGEPITLRVLAGSEVKDMAGVVEEAAKATNVRLTFEFTGTPDGSQAVADGKAAGKYDAIWFPSNRYLSRIPGASKRLGASTKIMASPVVLGVRRPLARKLGWDKKAPTWRDIAKAAEAKKFTYGMTDPSASNSGFSALVGVASALSGGGAALDAKRAIDVGPDLRRFFSGQTMTSGSSGWLADQFIKKSGKRGSPDGLVNYESVLLGLNAEGKLKQPLTVVIPADGVVTADYPLTLLSGADEPSRDAYAAVTEWLRSPVAQKMIMDQTSRRPAVPGIELDARFGDRLLVELPFPAQQAVVDDLITSYLNTIRRANQTIYVLDLSGSKPCALRSSRWPGGRARSAPAASHLSVTERGSACSAIPTRHSDRRCSASRRTSHPRCSRRFAARRAILSLAAIQRRTPHSGPRTGLQPGRPPRGPVP